MNAIIFCTIAIVALSTLAGVHASEQDLHRMAEQIVPKVAIESDEEFFDAWNLDHPGMEKVKAAVEAGDYDVAKVELKEYFLQRRTPPWNINHWDMPTEPKGTPDQHRRYQEGEDILANRFSAGGHEIQFEDNIDWNYFPLKRPDGRPDYEYPIPHFINRFSYFSVVLGPLYWFSLDERYAAKFVEMVTDFVLSYPAPEKYTPDAPGPWRQLTSASPLTGYWFDGYNYFLRSESFTPEAHAIMLKGFIEKARFAVRNPNAVNRYMIQLSAIYNVGAYFPELKQAENFRTFGVWGMELAAEAEFYPDTASKELCPGYHGGSRSAIRRIINSARVMGYETPTKLQASLKSTYDFYPKVATPLGGLPDFGDTWGPGYGSVQRIFAALGDEYDDPVFTWFATDGEEGNPPQFTSIRLPWAGFYIMRSDWDREALYLAMRAGPVGRDHWHEDFGTFEAYAYGEHLISEVGVYSYTYNKWNQYFRSSLSHNVVLVDGLSQRRAIRGGPFTTDQPRENDWHSDDVFDLAWGVHDGNWSDYMQIHWRGESGEPLAVFRRDICFVKDSYWVISDRLVADGEHTYSQLFHFRPDRTVEAIATGRAGTMDADRANIMLIQADPIEASVVIGQDEPPRGWFSAGHGQKLTPAAMVSFDQTAEGGARYDTVLFPVRAGQQADVAVERVVVTDADGNPIPASDVCALRIVTPEGTDYYVNDMRQQEIGPANGMVKIVGSMRTDARAAVVRTGPDGRVVAASATGGQIETGTAP